MSRRQVVWVEGLDHGEQPFPIATRLGNLLVTSGVHGRDRGTGMMPTRHEEQVANMFANIRAVLEAGGATVDDVAQVLVTLRDGELRPVMNRHWVEMFPDPDDRPVRNTQFRSLGGGMACSAIVTAVMPG